MIRFLAAPLLLALAVACSEAGTGTPLAPGETVYSTATGNLIECPTDETRSVSGTIGPLGGVLELDGHRLQIPANALLLPTDFTLTVPAGNYMKVRVRAGDAEHFGFLQPVSLTVSYSRCTRSNLEKSDLRIYYVDTSNVLLEDMGGTDDKVLRAVTIGTDHLSDYAIAAP